MNTAVANILKAFYISSTTAKGVIHEIELERLKEKKRTDISKRKQSKKYVPLVR
jgi:hypothetical protein